MLANVHNTLRHAVPIWLRLLKGLSPFPAVRAHSDSWAVVEFAEESDAEGVKQVEALARKAKDEDWAEFNERQRGNTKVFSEVADSVTMAVIRASLDAPVQLLDSMLKSASARWDFDQMVNTVAKNKPVATRLTAAYNGIETNRTIQDVEDLLLRRPEFCEKLLPPASRTYKATSLAVAMSLRFVGGVVQMLSSKHMGYPIQALLSA